MLYPDKCDVERKKRMPQEIGSNASYQPHLFDQPAVYSEKENSDFNSITAEWVNTTMITMLFPIDTDIKAGDRIKNIILRDGTKIPKNHGIEGVTRSNGRMHKHLSCTVKRIV